MSNVATLAIHLGSGPASDGGAAASDAGDLLELLNPGLRYKREVAIQKYNNMDAPSRETGGVGDFYVVILNVNSIPSMV